MVKKHYTICLLSLISYLNANVSDCISAPIEEEQGCSIASILEQPTKPSFKIREEKVNKKKVLEDRVELKITERLIYLEMTHKNHKLLIKRNSTNRKHTCPPFCIQPMNIKGVITVGELEVLDFIKDLKGKEAKLLIDLRKSKEYKEKTIPGAINIPYTMLDDNSKYQKQVLKLLGGKNTEEEWIFEHVPSLLIFGNSEETPEASQAIKTLLKLSYPNKKILFYRAGIDSWNRLGLSLY